MNKELQIYLIGNIKFVFNTAFAADAAIFLSELELSINLRIPKYQIY